MARELSESEGVIDYDPLRSRIIAEHAAAVKQLSPKPESDPAANGGNTTPQQQGIGKKEKALALLQQHPEWSGSAIADAAGCSRTSFYKWPEYKQARELLREQRGDLPTGQKDETGNIEAWEGDR